MISNDSDAKAFKVFDELLSELQSQLHGSVLCQGPDHSHALSFPSSQCLANSCGTFLTGDP